MKTVLIKLIILMTSLLTVVGCGNTSSPQLNQGENVDLASSSERVGEESKTANSRVVIRPGDGGSGNCSKHDACTNPPPPTICRHIPSGITADVGQIKDFYSSAQATCTVACTGIQRQCLSNGTFSAPIGSTVPVADLDIVYIHASCSSAGLNCTLPPPTTGGIEQPGCVAANTQSGGLWQNTFGQWPSFGVRRRLFVYNDTTLSWSFTTTNRNIFGTLATSDFPQDGDGVLLMTISETLGCVDRRKLDARCVTLNRFASVGWSLIPSAYSCPLKPGRTYYYNLTYTDPRDGGPVPSCEGGVCGVDIQNQIQ